MTNVLITGCGGFIGSHLAELMIKEGNNVVGTVFNFDGTKNIEHIRDKIEIAQLDMKNKNEIKLLVERTKPDFVYHLAAQSFVIPSWEDPENTMKTNVFGTMYLLDAIRASVPEAIVNVACSSAEYGYVSKEEVPIKETNPLKPSSPYAISKIGQDMFSFLYSKAYKMKIIRSRLFNVTGTRKIFDACSDFARGIAEAEVGKRDALKIGNLDGIRDITDVRDVVRALKILSEKGEHGEVYNICSGKSYKIGDLLNKLLSMSTKEIKIIKSPDPRRKIDDPIFLGDNTRLSSLGWGSEIPIEKTLSDMLEYWRNQVSN
ncbi:GDP-mannose 4,6-dehydratase [Candidatus Aenigmatarchaeota archaeon]